MAESQEIEIPVLGRSFMLGMLYDSRSDNVIPRITLWNQEELLKNIAKSPQRSSEYTVVAEDSLDQKSSALNVEAGLKLSFLGGLVSVGGAAKFLNDRKKSLRQSRVTMHYKAITKFEQLTMNHLAPKNIQHKDILDQSTATHVVTGITYGAEAFLIFDLATSSKENAVKVHGNLKAEIEDLINLATSAVVGGDVLAGANFTSERKKLHGNIEYTFYGDFILDSNPSTYEEAFKLCRDLPSRLGKNDENAVPKRVHLYPLSKLVNRAQQIVRAINNNSVTQTVEIMEDLFQNKLAADDLLSSPLYNHFPWMKNDVLVSKKAISNYEENFKESLMKILPGIRGGIKEETELLSLISLHRESPFDKETLTAWLTDKAYEQQFFECYLEHFGSVKICASEADSDFVINDYNRKRYVVCLNFCVKAMKDPNVSVLQDFLRPSKSSTAVRKLLWLNNPDARNKLREDIKKFLDFYENNVSNPEVQFLVAPASPKNEKGSDCVSQIVLFTDAVPQIFEPPGQITDLTTVEVSENSFKIQGKPPPQGLTFLSGYCCFYKARDPASAGNTASWSEVRFSMKNLDWTVRDLQPNTEYEFKIAGICPAGKGKDSAVRYVRTLPQPPPDRYIDALLKDSNKLLEGPPAIYDVRLHETFTDDEAQIRKFEIGKPDRLMCENPKVILLVGETGAGKSTLINRIINYMFNVQWEDNKQFKVVIEEGEESEQACSVTKWITAYTVFKQHDCPSPYPLTIIDTPGFGDTDGIARDEYITRQLKRFFSNKGCEGIDHIDAVGIVVQSTQARLTPSLAHVFNCITSVFAKNIADNIFLLMTFNDSNNNPPVLSAVKKAQLPYTECYKFNNGGLFSQSTTSDPYGFGKLYWEMGTGSIKLFFNKITTLKPQSLVLSEEVLRERENLEVLVMGLQPQIWAGFFKMDEITQLEKTVEQRGAKQDFVTEVLTTIMKKVYLCQGEYATNCNACNFSCHHPCSTFNAEGDVKCSAMIGDYCVVCPGKCHYKLHSNAGFRYQPVQEQQKQTMEELKVEYGFAPGQQVPKDELVSRMKYEHRQVDNGVREILQNMQKSLARLYEIALRPNPLSTTDYIDALIESEKLDKKPGYPQRIQQLQKARKQAELNSSRTQPNGAKNKPWWKL